MSMVYGARDDMAAIFTADEWFDIWNKNHPEDPAEDGYPAYVWDGTAGVWDDASCAGFDYETPGESPDAFEAGFGDFGKALDADPDRYSDITNHGLVTFHAPKGPRYFMPAYGSVDEMVDDIIRNSETFADTPEDKALVRNHLAWVNIAFYG